MSVSTYKNKVVKLTEDIASLSNKLALERGKEAKKGNELTRLERSITKSTSHSSLRTKITKADRFRQEIVKIQKNASDLQGRMARKNKELQFAQQRLHKEEDKNDKRRRSEELRHQKTLTNEVRTRHQLEALQDRLLAEFPDYETILNGEDDDQYDIFISHASQDKEDFVEPLSDLLRDMGFRIWYDDFVLKVGDSLRRSIDRGITRSKYGLVVLSPHFFAKAWPQHELDGLTAREIAGRKKLILPVWHNLGYQDVLEYSPPLADKIALDSQKLTLQEIAETIAEVLPGEPSAVKMDRIDEAKVHRAVETIAADRRLENLIQSVHASLAIEDPTVTMEEVLRVILRNHI